MRAKASSCVGQKHSMLTILEEWRDGRWFKAKCQCECGKVVVKRRDHVIAGLTKSCGCASNRWKSEHNTEHGHCPLGNPSPEYKTWCSMVGRCTRPNDPNFHHYGGRGILVCERWRDSFENFLADMGPRPSAKHSIERIDNDQGYGPHNCKWILRSLQTQNTRRNRFLEIYGKRQCMSAWARIAGIKPERIYSRLKRGWPEKAAVFGKPQGAKT